MAHRPRKSVARGTRGSEGARSEGRMRAASSRAGAGGYGVLEVAVGLGATDVDGDAGGVAEGLAVGLVVGDADGDVAGVDVAPGEEGDEGVGDGEADGD